MTKKNNFSRKLFIIFFILLAVIFYIYTYLFPSIKKINRLKRDIKEISITKEGLREEKVNFIGMDEREKIVIKKVEDVLKKRLPALGTRNNSSEIIDIIKGKFDEYAENLKLNRFEIIGDTHNPVKIGNDSVESRFENLYHSIIVLKFRSDMNSALRLIELSDSIIYYMIPKKIIAFKSGESFVFRVESEVFFKDAESELPTFSKGADDLIDWDSPFLRKRVHTSPFQINEKTRSIKSSGSKH